MPALMNVHVQDSTVRVWNTQTHQCTAVLRGHTAGVLSIAIAGDLLVTASSDRTVKVCTSRGLDLMCRNQPSGNENALTCTNVSVLRCLQLWDVITHECVGHARCRAAVFTVNVIDRVIYCGLQDNSVLKFDMDDILFPAGGCHVKPDMKFRPSMYIRLLHQPMYRMSFGGRRVSANSRDPCGSALWLHICPLPRGRVHCERLWRQYHQGGAKGTLFPRILRHGLRRPPTTCRSGGSRTANALGR